MVGVPMRKILWLVMATAVVAGGWWGVEYWRSQDTGAPPYAEADIEPPDTPQSRWANWKRPIGPAKVALQAGHWQADEVPEELVRLRSNTGSSGGGKWEWEVNLAIAQATEKILEDKGLTVEILPATVPPEYWADVFLAIHADGSLDHGMRGFKIARPRRDFTGRADNLVDSLTQAYGAATGLPQDPNISRNMRGYYAFAWWRYEHAIHPMTTAAIAETGFLTNAADRRVLIGGYQTAAAGLATGILNYLQEQGLWEGS